VGAPRGAAGPSPGQVWPAVASCVRLWPGCGRFWPAAAGSGQLRPAVVRPSLAKLRPDLAMVRPDQARCFRPCTFALVQPFEVHLFIVIPISMYLQVKIPTKFVIFSSHSSDNDGQKFVVMTVNKLPNTWLFARPRAKSKLGLCRSGVA
jgi:hypothetical protein